MLACFLRCLARFSTSAAERPFTPALWNAMSMANLGQLSQQQRLQGVLHAMRLMEGGITAFDYDFYQWSCWRIVQQQQQLSKEEILLVMRLGRKYRITLEPIQQHIENELFLRIHRDYEPELQQYDEGIRKDMAALMQKLEKQSRDYFNLLQQEGQEKDEEEAKDEANEEDRKAGSEVTADVEVEKGEQEKQEGDFQVVSKWTTSNTTQAQAEKYILTMNRKLKRRAQKEFSMSDLVEVLQLLRASGSKNLPLLQYILQLLTIKYESAATIDPQEMLQYVQALTFVCQQLMGEFSGNRKRYTTRSVKRIYKFQTIYYQEHLRQLAATYTQLSTPQLEQLVATYAAFPLKRRAVRRRIGSLLCEEVRRRQLQETGLVKVLIGINGKDEKMKKSYCEMMGLDLQHARQIGLYREKQKALPAQESKKEGEQVEKREVVGEGVQNM